MTQRGACTCRGSSGSDFWMARTCGVASECSSLLGGSVFFGRSKGCSNKIVGQKSPRCISCNVPTIHGQAGADAPVSGADGCLAYTVGWAN